MSFPEFGNIVQPAQSATPEYPEFGKIISPSLGKEKLGDKVLRNILRTGAVGVSSVAGIPGDIQQGIEAAPGGIAKLFGAEEEGTDKASDIARRLTRGIFGKNLSSGQELKEAAQKLSKGYLAPQTPGEAFSDEVTEFVAPILSPLKGVGTIDKAKRLFKVASLGIASTALGRKIEKETGSHGAGQAAKIGSYVMMSLFNPKGMSRYLSNLYGAARETIKGDVPLLNTKNYVNNLTGLEKEINSSLAPSSVQKTILNKINEIKTAATEEVNPNRILDTKQSINSDLSDLMKQSDRATRKKIRGYMKRISGITNDALREYGEKNPKFWELQKSADNAFATKAESELIANNVQKALEGHHLPHLEKALPLGLHFAGKAIPAIGSLKAGAATPLYFMGRFAYRYAKSPTLRKYYNNLLTGGMEGDAKLIQSSAQKVEKELAKESLK